MKRGLTFTWSSPWTPPPSGNSSPPCHRVEAASRGPQARYRTPGRVLPSPVQLRPLDGTPGGPAGLPVAGGVRPAGRRPPLSRPERAGCRPPARRRLGLTRSAPESARTVTGTRSSDAGGGSRSGGDRLFHLLLRAVEDFRDGSRDRGDLLGLLPAAIAPFASSRFLRRNLPRSASPNNRYHFRVRTHSHGSSDRRETSRSVRGRGRVRARRGSMRLTSAASAADGPGRNARAWVARKGVRTTWHARSPRRGASPSCSAGG